MKELKDKVAVVTGAASGIGRGMAEVFAEAGMKVVLSDIEQPVLEQTARELLAAGADVHPVVADVARPEQVDQLAEQTLRKYGAVHILCNNAGVGGSGGLSSWTNTLKDWQWILGVNLMGVVHSIRTFLSIMIDQDTAAHIVNTASLAGLVASPMTLYCTTKFAVVGLSEGVHLELRRANLKPRISVLCPGVVDTNILDSQRNRPAELVNDTPAPPSPMAQVFRAWLGEQLKQGLSPRAVGEQVLSAIRDERFYILTHPAQTPAIEQRLRDIIRGDDPTPLPIPGIESLGATADRIESAAAVARDPAPYRARHFTPGNHIMADINRQVLIAELPKGKLAPEHFRLVESALPTPVSDQVLLRIRYIVVDAAMRAWMLGPTYRAALRAGDVMAGAALAEVVDSRAPDFASGDLVYTNDAGCQDYAVVAAATLTKLSPIDPVTHLISVYGVAGLTAYFGLLELGKPQPGETVVVSAAAGAVGSIAGQIAKLKGCRVVGIAGGKAKCDMLIGGLGFDAAVDYKAGNLHPSLMAATQGGTDVYFDNVGGEVFEAVLFTMKPRGRLVACGAVSAYDTDPAKGIHSVRGVPTWFISRRLTLRGFIVSDFYADRASALLELQGWVERGQLKVLEDVVEGLENFPRALIGLLAGENLGKRMLKIS